MTVENRNTHQDESVSLNRPVFVSSSLVILVLGILLVLFPAGSEQWLSHAQLWITDVFGWY